MHLTQLILYKTPWKLNRKKNNCHSFNTQYKEKDNTHSLNEWMKGWDRATQGNLTSPNTYIQRRSRGFAGVTECWYLSFLFHRSIDTGNKWCSDSFVIHSRLFILIFWCVLCYWMYWYIWNAHLGNNMKPIIKKGKNIFKRFFHIYEDITRALILSAMFTIPIS